MVKVRLDEAPKPERAASSRGSRLVVSNVLWVFGALLAAACSGAPGGADEPGLQGDRTQEIRGGTVVSGAYGIVDFFHKSNASLTEAENKCTGTIIAPNAILTAAHCFHDFGSATTTSGTFPTSIRYFDPEAGPRFVFQGAAQWTKFPTYNGWDNDFPGDANDDFALIITPEPLAGTDYHDYKRIYADANGPLGGWLRHYGAGMYTYSGRDDANLRTGSFEVESVNSNHIIVDNQDNLNTCGGDSGGPAIKLASVPGAADSLELVVGVLGIHESGSEGINCADNEPWFGSTGGDNSAFGRVNNSEMNWIEAQLGRSCNMTGGSTADLLYKRCFDLPFVEDVEFEGRTRNEAVAIVSSIL